MMGMMSAQLVTCPRSWLRQAAGLLLLSFNSCTGATALQDVGLSAKEYRDPRGLFTILPPAGWRVQEYPEDPRGKVAFLAPTASVEFRILARAVDVEGFDDVVANTEAQADEIRRRCGARVTTSRASLGGDSAVRVEAELLQAGKPRKLLMFNFVRGKVLHNLTFGAPVSEYTKHWPVVNASMETYQPLARDVSSADIVRHTVAAKKRRAELDISRGDFENALRMVNEGLDLDPLNSELIDLKRTILTKIQK